MGDVMLKDILMSVSKKMQIDFEGITSKIQHNGEKGTARENILEEYLKCYIPENIVFRKVRNLKNIIIFLLIRGNKVNSWV